jgi:hypothetical protein
MDNDLAQQVIDAANRVVAGGAISANGHGNVSIRVPGTDEMYFTAGPSLCNHSATAIVRVGLDGTLREGEAPADSGCGRRNAHRDVRGQPRCQLRHPHALPVCHCVPGGASSHRVLGRSARDVRPREWRAGDRIWPTRIRPRRGQHQIGDHAGRPCDPAGQSRGARAPQRRRDRRGPSRFRKSCARQHCSGRWRLRRKGPREPEPSRAPQNLTRSVRFC